MMQDQPKQQPGVQPPAEAGRGGQPAANKQGFGGRRGGVQGPGIVFDSDMGRNIDTALALAMLYSLGPKGRVIAVGVSNSSLQAAAFCDAVARFYEGDPNLLSNGTRPMLPVGLADNGAPLGSVPMLGGPLAMKKPDGTPLFVQGVRDITDTADVRTLIRNALLSQKDQEGIVVLAGPATDLVRTMAVNGGKEVISSKVGLLVAATGAYPTGPADPRVKADIASARQLFREWPSPIVAVGTEVGAALPYPGRSIESDFSWSPAHPVVAAYRAFKPMPYDAPAQALAAVLYAADRNEGYFKLSEPGMIEVLDDGRTRFSPSANGKDRYLIVDPSQKQRVIQEFTELASAKPTPPAGRRGFRNRQAKQAAGPVNPATAPAAEPPKPAGRSQE